MWFIIHFTVSTARTEPMKNTLTIYGDNVIKTFKIKTTWAACRKLVQQFLTRTLMSGEQTEAGYGTFVEG